MLEKVELPFDDSTLLFNPEVTFPYSIAKAKINDNILTAVCNEHINCNFQNSNCGIEFSYGKTDGRYAYKNILKYHQIDLLTENIVGLEKELPILFKNSVSQEIYICGRAFWGTEIHYIITGYDDNKRTFSIRYMNESGTYFKNNIDYSDFSKALGKVNNFKTSLGFWLYEKEMRFDIDISDIVLHLNEYISSKSWEILNSQDRIYGFNAIRKLSENLNLEAESKKEIKICNLKGLSEHKSFMLNRMKILSENKYLDKPYIEKAYEVQKISQKIIELGEAYNKTQNRDIINKIQDLINNTIYLEKQYLTEVVEDLKRKL